LSDFIRYCCGAAKTVGGKVLTNVRYYCGTAEVSSLEIESAAPAQKRVSIEGVIKIETRQFLRQRKNGFSLVRYFCATAVLSIILLRQRNNRRNNLLTNVVNRSTPCQLAVFAAAQK
jgi:hypothetical protein